MKRKRELTLAPSDMPASKTARKKAPIPPLPAGADDANRFRLVFIPTYERWVGMQANPWVIPDSITVKVLQAIWNTVYVHLPYTVIAGDVVFDRVCTFISFRFLFLTPSIGHTTSLRMAQLLQVCS